MNYNSYKIRPTDSSIFFQPSIPSVHLTMGNQKKIKQRVEDPDDQSWWLSLGSSQPGVSTESTQKPHWHSEASSVRAIKVVEELDMGYVERDEEKLGLFNLRTNVQRDLIPPNSSLPFQRDFGTRKIDIQKWSHIWSAHYSCQLCILRIRESWRETLKNHNFEDTLNTQAARKGHSAMAHPLPFSRDLGHRVMEWEGKKKYPGDAHLTSHGGASWPQVWFEHTAFWFGVRCAASTPQDQGWGCFLLKYHSRI